MPIPSPAFARYRLQWLLLGLSLLLLLLALQHAFHQVTELNKRDTINAATHFSSQYQRMEAFLEAMRGQAEERLRTDPEMRELAEEHMTMLVVTHETRFARDCLQGRQTHVVRGLVDGRGACCGFRL